MTKIVIMNLKGNGKEELVESQNLLEEAEKSMRISLIPMILQIIKML